MQHGKIGMLHVESWLKLAKSLGVHPWDLLEFAGIDWLPEDEEENINEELPMGATA
jgi:hypothetical protein